MRVMAAVAKRCIVEMLVKSPREESQGELDSATHCFVSSCLVFPSSGLSSKVCKEFKSSYLATSSEY